jgi:hypothetical protein
MGCMSAPQTANRATQLRRTSRKVGRTNQVLAAMRSGQSLHLQHRDGRPLWSLSGGRSVAADVAAIVIRHALVVPADTALFTNLPGQSWEYAK